MFSMLLGIVVGVMLIACILFVLVGQITVRKLRRNPETKHELGARFINGWEILNVAQAIAWPSFNRKVKKGQLGHLEADPDILLQHTNKLDRILCVAFFWLYVTSASIGIILVFISALGLVE